MSLYSSNRSDDGAGVVGAARAERKPKVKDSSLKSFFRWAFIYIAVSSLLMWLVRLSWRIKGGGLHRPDATAITVFGLIGCLIFGGLAVVASFKRRNGALAGMILLAVVGGIAQVVFHSVLRDAQAAGMATQVQLDAIRHAALVSSSVGSLGVPFGWLTDLAIRASGNATSMLFSQAAWIQQGILVVFCFFAMAKQPKE